MTEVGNEIQQAGSARPIADGWRKRRPPGGGPDRRGWGGGGLLLVIVALALGVNPSDLAGVANPPGQQQQSGDLGVGGKDGVHAPGVRTDPAAAANFAAGTGIDALGESRRGMNRDG